MKNKGRKQPPPVTRGGRKPVKAPAKPSHRTRRRDGAPGARGLVPRALGASLRLAGRLLWAFTWRMAVAVVAIVAIVAFHHYTKLPELQALLDGRARGSVTLLDRDDKVFAWRGESFGGQISAKDVSEHLRNAIIATEDRRFYLHFGISPRGIASAIRINLSQGRGPFEGHGGSTITQQVAKLLCLGEPFDPAEWESEAAYERDCRRTTLWRKVREVPYSLALEAKYAKNDILTIYLNRAYLGAGARGFEAAAQRYFGKSANRVDPAEAAMLAGLLVAPSHYAPTRNMRGARERANLIIGLMEEQGYLTPAQAAHARANPAELSDAARERAGGFFADWMMSSGPSFLTRETTEDVVLHTTFDQQIQKAAEDALAKVFENRVREGSEAEAAIVVMSANGAVRAMVGGRDKTVVSAFNRATMARRQTGSAFKPFIYGAALDLGYGPNDLVRDEPLSIDVPGSGTWSPENYTEDYKGTITLTRALAESINVPAIKVSETVGRDLVRKVASEFGIESGLADGPALALGVSEATLLEMTSAYAGILNGGSSVEPYGMRELHLAGDDQPLIDRAAGGIGERVISERAARQLTYMLSQVIERGTGQRAALPDRQVAGKTGTTQAARDAWFIGFTADYVAGVWMGYDDNTPLTGVTGGGLPAEIWRETMARVNEGMPRRPLPMLEPERTDPPRASRDGSGASSPVERILRDVLGTLAGPQ